MQQQAGTHMIMTGRDAIIKARYFSLEENWGDPDKVDSTLILEADSYREMLGHRLHISPKKGAVYAESGHSDESWHYIIEGRNELACAMDVFPDCDLAYAWITALRFDFGGIGAYPMAVYNEKGIVGMLHLDMRPERPRVLWWRDEKGDYHYLRDSMDTERLLSYLIV